MKRSMLVFPVAAIVLWSCSHAAPGPEGAPATSSGANVVLQNPINFPLLGSSTILATKQFSQTVSAGQHASGLLAAGSGIYGGTEVIAGSGETFAQLQAELRKQETDPPKGYRHQGESSGVATARQMTTQRGVDFAVFRDANNPKRGVLVVVIDPATANRNFGPIATLVKRYQVLPAALRGNIESAVKRRSGISIDQMTQPGSPLGVALNAMSEFSDKNQRAVVLVDATKE